jgi:Beta/Gamma crystallin/Domain of unknown function (DUF4214)
MKRLLFFLFFGGAIIPAFPATHQEDERRRNEPRVILYQHADFRGEALELYPGEAIENLSGRTFPNGSGLNDSVSSIRIEGGAEVYVYEHARFRGQVLRLSESVRDLSFRRLPDNPGASWNDHISSLKVEAARRRPGEREIDYDGMIKRAYRDLLGHEPDNQGLRYYHGLMIDQGWSERMVRDHIQHGEEFRREAADRLIRRAYKDLLGREPDESGLRHYRQMVMEHDWTENEVRDNIRRSEEFRRKSVRP